LDRAAGQVDRKRVEPAPPVEAVVVPLVEPLEGPVAALPVEPEAVQLVEPLEGPEAALLVEPLEGPEAALLVEPEPVAPEARAWAQSAAAVAGQSAAADAAGGVSAALGRPAR
jgi:hypothetical protein